ncbi:ATP-binding cassette sub- A member 13 [Saguinus oedipus]|uniref:ATP-binding cassette sub- A member 13 n=1 Tax=Saguinus oedipus TaxID=9490 RepID=A0ABQ9UG21_SAGOE|nr:ATP-binding cassette sub- A member 13 [Saguinus oedipus]
MDSSSGGDDLDLTHVLLQNFRDQDLPCTDLNPDHPVVERAISSSASKPEGPNDSAPAASLRLQKIHIRMYLDGSGGCKVNWREEISRRASAPYLTNHLGHTLLNLSGFNVEEYLLAPSEKPRSLYLLGGFYSALEILHGSVTDAEQKRAMGRTEGRGQISCSLQECKHFMKADIARVPLLDHSFLDPLAPSHQIGFRFMRQRIAILSFFVSVKRALLSNVETELMEDYSNVQKLEEKVGWLPSVGSLLKFRITLYSHPYGGALLNEDKILESIRQCGVALCIVLGFSILSASIGTSVVRDRVTGAKRLQHISGLGYRMYWFTNFLYDMLFYLVSVCLCVAVIVAFQLTAFTFRENLAATALLLSLFGYATLPWMYLMSRIFSSSDVAFISYVSLNFIFGLCTMLITIMPRLLAIISKAKNLQNIYDVLKWIFTIFPQFCLGQGLIELCYNQIKYDLTHNFGIDSYSIFTLKLLNFSVTLKQLRPGDS